MLSTRIHPLAVVDSGAQIGAGVTVGPFSVIGPDVTLQDGLERGAAELQVRKMAKELLANPIVEDFQIQWLD